MIEILSFDGCLTHEGLAVRLRSPLAEAGVDTPITSRRIESDEDAELERFLGSPTIRINGVDVDPTASERTDYGLACRVYATEDGPRGSLPAGGAGLVGAVAVVLTRRGRDDGGGQVVLVLQVGGWRPLRKNACMSRKRPWLAARTSLTAGYAPPQDSRSKSRNSTNLTLPSEAVASR